MLVKEEKEVIEKADLLEHFREYAARPDEHVADREGAKRQIVERVLSEMNFQTKRNIIRVAVLGASDARYIGVHQRVFEAAFPGKKVAMTTFDIDTEHLKGEKGILEHDVNHRFPSAPFDIVFSHELMKFLTAKSQVTAIKNSWDALSGNGIAFHIIHEPSIKGTDKLKPWQFRVNPDNLVSQLRDKGLMVRKFEFMTTTMFEHMRETTVLVVTS